MHGYIGDDLAGPEVVLMANDRKNRQGSKRLNSAQNAGTNGGTANHPQHITRRIFVRGGIAAGAALVSYAKASSSPAASVSAPRPLIMLDPGHGGHDPGAVGITGTFEKNVALHVANELQQALAQNGRYRVLLTREQDVYVPLMQRTAHADAHNAQLLVSIHADALTDRGVRGASVYSRSDHASDAQTDELAQRENGVDGGSDAPYGQYPPEVANILDSLALRETRMLSRRLQANVIKSLSDRIRMLHRPSREADFVVLRSHETPSILIEMGFMSSAADEKLLQDRRHLQTIVAAMGDGLQAWIKHSTP